VKLKLITVVGTRPELIRLSCILSKLDENFNHVLVNTNQNFDKNLNNIFFKQLKIKKPKYNFKIENKNSSINFIGKLLIKFDNVIKKENPDALLVLGDTNSSLSALCAKKNKIPVFHMEAGNRCFDDRVPEEVNRRIVDHFSDINLTYSNYASENLQREGLRKDRIIKVGSPLMEVYDKYKKQIEKNDILKKLNLTKNNYILASIHREENVSKLSNVKKILEGIYRIKKELKVPIIFSTHPRTKSILKKVDLNIKKEINFLKPFGFFEFAKLLKNAKLTISDSGSITEEASILSIPTVNLRSTNERQEGMEFGISIMSGLSADSIFNSYKMSMKNKDVKKSYPDYSNLNVSNTVSTIIQSYTHYINEKVWLKKN
jgi:UDP-N-acetylglucosamine 2-epimerase